MAKTVDSIINKSIRRQDGLGIAEREIIYIWGVRVLREENL